MRLVRCLECVFFYPINEWEGYCEKTGRIIEGSASCNLAKKLKEVIDMGRRGSKRSKRYKKERWYKCPKRNGQLVPYSTCKDECGAIEPKCEWIERKVIKGGLA